MINIEVSTGNIRGFLKTLFEYKFSNINFYYGNDSLYEIPSYTRKKLAKIIKWKIFDYLGVFYVVKAKNKSKISLNFSYNRFLKSDKPYIIFLENPCALINYSWDRQKFFLTKVRLQKLFHDPNLKTIICMSKTCYDNFYHLYPDSIFGKVNLKQIYPLVLKDKTFTLNEVREKCSSDILNCIYISSDFDLKGGCDLLEVFKHVDSNCVHLTCITKKDTIKKNEWEIINKLNNVKIVEFNLSKDELAEYYKRSAILLYPTRADSFSLVTLEAMKYGCCILATDVYAIKEMVIDGVNGYITKPAYPIWDADGNLNKFCREHPQQTISSGFVNNEIVHWMLKKITMLVSDRAKLFAMCTASYIRGDEGEFSEMTVVDKWNEVIEESVGR